MSRTTFDAVAELLGDGQAGGNYDTVNQPSLQGFIETASAVVDRVATCATRKGLDLSTTELELIERWLAAHFYCVVDPIYTSRSTNGASASFQVGQAMEGFGSTEYGRQALAMDYSGCLKNISLKQRARSVWTGKVPSEQIPYEDRD